MKKSIARKGKSCTFAPAFGRKGGERQRGIRERPIFESLRPAQAASREGCRKDKEKERPRRGSAVAEGGTRDSEKNKKQDNSTTKSLILAQDER